MHEAYIWVMKNIKGSCSDFQFKCCLNLLELFYAKYGFDCMALYVELYDELLRRQRNYAMVKRWLLNPVIGEPQQKTGG